MKFIEINKGKQDKQTFLAHFKKNEAIKKKSKKKEKKNHWKENVK